METKSAKMRGDEGIIVILCFLLLVCLPNCLLVASPSSSSSSCQPDQRHALLRFIHSFSVTDNYCWNTSYPKVDSWSEDEDCCSWEGVTCHNSSGDIIGLNLTCAGLRGSINSSSPLFSLHHLRELSLFGNDFVGSAVPPEISMFTRLEYLDLSYSNISGILPTEISHLLKLVFLDLSQNSGLEMQDYTMRMLFGNLTQLEELDLSSVNMSTATPTSFMNLSSSLMSLKLSECSMGGKFPEFIFGLPNLLEIDLSRNDLLSGTLPESKRSPRLEYLSLWGCSFTGTIPNSIGNLSRLTYLNLSWNNFTGGFDSAIFSTLRNLSGLPIPGEDASNNFSMPYLQELYMENSNLNKFPSFLSRSKELRILDLRGNKIQELPDWFWSIGIDTLEELDLGNNSIRGGFHLLPWKKLVMLDLEFNYFEGPHPIPQPSIREFGASYNRFNGSILASICHLTSLSIIYLDGNNLTGVVPQCLGNLTNLVNLNLRNNSLSGPLPPSLANCTSLGFLDVSYNSISDAPPTWLSTSSITNLYLSANNFLGQWPSDFFLRSASLISIDLSDNKFEGPLLVLPSTTYYYSVSNNHFSGEISSQICNASNLLLLDLSNNNLIGVLPDCLKNVTFNLEYLNLRANEFHGQIPEIFHEGSNLMSFDLSRNQFEGPLPRSLFHCKSLAVLDVGSNKITDSFPNWLGDLSLQVLSLRSNNFHGNVSKSVGTQSFSQVRVLDLSNNRFEGNISDEFIGEMLGMERDNNYEFPGSYMTSNNGSPIYFSVMIDLKGKEMEMVKINVQFALLDLSNNRFQGEIPISIGLLKSLKGLNLSHNGFTGTITSSIGNLLNLAALDLSSNHLFGEIPKELVKLTYLGALDLSSNNLTGPIPPGGHINTFSNSSFKGNPGLCGIPLSRECGVGYKKPQSLPEGKGDGEEGGGGWLECKYMALGFGSGMGIGISLGYMVMEIGKPLWLVRVIIQLKAGDKKMSKRKGAPSRNGRR